MKYNKRHYFILASIFHVLMLYPFNQISAKTITTKHYTLYTGTGWSAEENNIIDAVSRQLDNVWTMVNALLENELPAELKLEITREGLSSRSIREEGTIILNASHIINLKIQDCLNRIAHETAHVALYRMSKGNIIKQENKFLDEGIALYVGYLYVKKDEELNALSQNIAQEDFLNERASLNYLRDWNVNVRDKQREFNKKWHEDNPGKTATLEDYFKAGYRTYFTSYSFVKKFNNKYGFSQILNVIRRIGKGNSQADVFLSITGQSLDEFVSEWHASLK